MKTKLLSIIIVVFTIVCNSQNYQTVEDINDACAQLGFAGDEDAEIAVDNILDKMGLYRNFVIQECPNINNAVAKNIDIGSGKKERYILYDNSFFNKIDEKAGNDWAATSVLAHEIGHHLNGHALNDEGSNHKWELEADEFSGFVLARMEATLEDAQSAIQTLKYEKATRTHPAKADRLIAIEKGYHRGNGKIIIVKPIDDEVIKDLTEDIAEEITENKIEDDYVAVDGITAEQVLANYIEAIGGQEKVASIKTFFQDRVMTMSAPTRSKMSYLSPSKMHQEISVGTITTESLIIGDKQYSKGKGQKSWQLNQYYQPLYYKNMVSYIPELSLLIRNVDAKYLGIKNINNVACYSVSIVPDQFSKTELMQVDKYFDTKTGLLYCEDINLGGANETHTVNRTYYLDYRSVNGVLFSYLQEASGTTSVNGKDISYTYTVEFSEMKINPILNKDDFDPTK